MKQMFLVCFCMLPALYGYNQTSLNQFKSPEKNNTLLWRISGNGLKQSSYLFGTMHLNDKRLFNFDDSVYYALEKCEGMAIEVNPDEMVAYVVNNAFDDQLKSERLKNILSSNDFKRYNRKLSRKFKKQADELTTADIVRQKSNWVSEYLEKGEMPSVVDAYLYNLARKQGKWVGGIEDIADQAGLLEDNFDKTDIEYILADDKSSDEGKKTTEQMIKLYTAQDLEGINKYMNSYTSVDEKDALLIRRNIKMARRIDSLSAFRSMFFAVGAAHLPGDSGVIDLLRRNGFSVTPVFSSVKIESKNYKPKEIDIPWVTVKDKLGYYDVEMPLNPTPVKVFGLVDMNFLLDIFTNSGYYTMTLPLSIKDEHRDSMLHKLAQQIFQTNKKLTARPVKKENIKGLEFMDVSAIYKLRLQLYTDDNVVHAAVMFALKQPMLQSANANRFFNSFKLKKPKEGVTGSVYLFTDSIMGIQFQSPAVITQNDQFSRHDAEGWNITAFTGTDMKTGSVIMIFSRDVKPGYVLNSDSTVFEMQFDLFKKDYNKVNRRELIGGEGRIIEISGLQKQNPALFSKAYSTVRDNRNILLFVISDSANFLKPEIQNVFKSLSFIKSTGAKWNWYSDNQKGFRAWLPGELRPVPESFSNHNQVLSYDTSNATSYFIAYDTVQKYQWFKSDTSLLNKFLSPESDEIAVISSKNVVRGKMKGKEMLYRFRTNFDLYQRSLILLSDSIVYHCYVSGGKEMVTGQHSTRFFESLQIKGAGSPDVLTKSKLKFIISDLHHPDSEVRYAASYALDDAPLEEKDLPVLHEALFRPYLSKYDSTRGTEINSSLMSATAKLKSPSTVRYIRSKYQELAADTNDMQTVALAGLAEMKTAESYSALADLLVNRPLKFKLDYSLRNLEDSLQLTAEIFPRLLSMAGDTNAVMMIAAVTMKMLDSNRVTLATIKEKETLFTNAAAALSASFKDESYFSYGSYDLLKLLGRIGTREAFQVLRNYTAAGNEYLALAAARQLVKANESVPLQLFEKLAADTAMRFSLYETLSEENRLSLFPKKYLSQASLAQSSLYNLATEEDYEAVTIEPAGTREAVFKGRKQVFYLFKVIFHAGSEKETYLGISDAYERDKNILKPAENIEGIYYSDGFDKGAISEQFQTYLREKGNSVSEAEIIAPG